MSSELIIIGFDVGLTYTGVAFSTADGEGPSFIHGWPGLPPNSVKNKVPTKLCYRAGCRKPISWGYQCPEPEELERGMDVIDYFKLYLDPAFRFERLGNSPEVFWTNEDVQMWFIDFLSALRGYIISYIRQKIDYVVGDWKLNPVKYLFSFPTTWQNTLVVDAFREIVERAGFADSDDHSIEINLSEAAAAAVYSTKYFKKQHSLSSGDPHIRQGHVILNCDAGGGTTDVSVLEVLSTQTCETGRIRVEEVFEMKQLDFVRGKPIGSVLIDRAFQRKVAERLERIDNRNESWRYTARDIAKTTFQGIKMKVGEPVFSTLASIHFRIPGLPTDFNHRGAGIEKGVMIFTKAEIRSLFDEQIYHIFKLIDEQLQRIEELTPPQTVTHLVLSGGLGSSEYVQYHFRSKYDQEFNAKKILIAEKPQLAVCGGLVIDCMHRLKHGRSIISAFCSRFSYGIATNKRINGSQTDLYRREDIRTNSLDKRRYVVNHIDWFVERGDILHRRENISRKFNYFVDVNAPEVFWKDHIVMSRSPAHRLPRTTNEGDARVVCVIESRVDQENIKRHAEPVKIQKWWGAKPKTKPHKIQYEVRLFVESSCFKFEVLLGDQVVGESDRIPLRQLNDMDELSRLKAWEEVPVNWENVGP